MTNLLKRLGSLALALIMVVSLLPFNAMHVHADGEEIVANAVPEGWTPVGSYDELTAALADKTVDKIWVTQSFTASTTVTFAKATSPNLTIDFNGNVITGNKGDKSYAFINQTNLTLMDSSKDGKGGFYYSGSAVSQLIRNENGTLTIESGTYHMRNTTTSNRAVLYTFKPATINGGTFKMEATANTTSTSNGSAGYAAAVLADGAGVKLTIENGTFEATRADGKTGPLYALCVTNGNVTINNGNFSVTADGDGSVAGHAATIATRSNTGATLTINNGTFTSTQNSGNARLFEFRIDSTVTVKDGTFTSNIGNIVGAVNTSSASFTPTKLNITGGQFQVDAVNNMTNYFPAGYYQTADGTVFKDEHQFATEQPAKNATCEEDGWAAYKQCDYCGAYVDANGQVIGNTADAVENWKANDGKVTGSHNAQFVAAKDAVCETMEDGNIAYWHCDVCGKYWSDEALSVEIQQAETVIKAQHTFVDGVCSVCGDSACAGGHLFEGAELVPEQAATCLTDGRAAHYVCVRCRGAYANEQGEEVSWDDLLIPKDSSNHANLRRVEEKEATLYLEGHEAYWTCDCNALFADNNGEMGDAITEIPTTPVIPAVATIGDNKFASLQAAVDAALPNDCIVMQQNHATDGSVVVDASKEITIDLNGKTIDVGDKSLVNNGTLTLKDSAAGGIITGTGSVVHTESENGALTIEGGKYLSTAATAAGYAVYAKKGDLNIKDGTFRVEATNGKNGYAARLEAGDLTVTGGKFEVYSTNALSYGIYLNSGSATISGATIDVHAVGAKKNTYGIYSMITATIDGNTKIDVVDENNTGAGTITGIYHTASGKTLTVENTEVKVTSDVHGDNGNPYGVYSKAGTVELKAGTKVELDYTWASSKTRGVHLLTAAGGNINVRGGEYTVRTNSTAASIYATYVTSTMNIYDGTFEQIGGGSNASIFYINGATAVANVYGGEFTGVRQARPTMSGALNIHGGTFINKNATSIDMSAHYVQAGEDVTDPVVAEVTYLDEPNKITVCDEVDDFHKAVSAYGADGKAVVKLLADVTDGTRNPFTYSFELDLNGKTWIQNSGNALYVEKAGTEKAVTYIHDGYLLSKGANLTYIDDGALHMKNVTAYATSAMPVAYHADGSEAINKNNLIENCTLIGNRYFIFSFRDEAKAQGDVEMTFRDTKLINIYNANLNAGTIFLDGMKGTNGKYILDEGVEMYTIVNRKYNASLKDSEVVYADGCAEHKIAAAQYEDVNAILADVGGKIGYTENQSVYTDNKDPDAVWTTSPTLIKWTTEHTYDQEATCTSGPACSCGATNGEALPHAMTFHKEVAASCTENGTVAYYSCSTCGKNFADEAGETELTELTITAGHKWTAKDAKDATCSATGNIAYFHCDNCGEYAVEVEGNKVITEWSEIEIEKEAHTYGEPSSWTWAEVDGNMTATATFTCSVCEDGTEGHTKTENATVTYETTDATCTAEGKTVYTATVGDKTATKEVTIPMVEHTMDANNEKPATCTDAGHKAYYTCSVCEKNFADAEGETEITNLDAWKAENGDGYIKPLDHIYDQAQGWTSNGDGTHYQDCDRCGEAGRTYENCTEVAFGEKAPTCTEPGFKAGTKCSVCDGTIKPTEIDPALGHDFENGTVTDEFAGNCQTESYVTTKCSRCDVTNTVKGDKNTAVHTNLVKDDAVPATCTATGLKEGEHCEDCKVVTIEQIVTDKLGHDFEHGTVTETFAGNCQTESYVTTKCARCEETNTVKGEKNPAVHTNLVKDDAVAATCTATGKTEGEHCEDCKVVTKPQTETPKLGHSYEKAQGWTSNGDGTHYQDCDRACGEAGRKYENCADHAKQTDGRDATCTAEGMGAGTYCEVCEYVISAAQTTPALGHDFENGTVTETFAGNCQTESYVTTKCSRCDVTNTVKGEKNPAVHTNLVKDDAVPATCTATGKTEGEHCEDCKVVTKPQTETPKLGHDFENGTVTETFAGNCQTESYVTTKCSRCDVTNTVKGEKNTAVHTNLVKDAAVPATCTETGLEEGEHCEDCGVVTIAQKETSKLGHDFEHGTVTDEFAGNCQTESYVTTQCSRCDVTETVTGEKNTAVHTNLVKDAAVAATCTETGLEEGEHCEACGVVTIAQKETAKLGHDFENGTVTDEFAGNCQTESYVTTKCSRCDVTETVTGEKNPAVHTNLVKDDAVPATCTETGLEEGEHCEDCGVVTIAQKETSKLGHDFQNYVSNNDATCDADGTETAKCERCDATDTRTDEGSILPTVAKIGEVKYPSLQAAVDAAQSDATVKLMKDATLSKKLTINKLLTIDLNGHTITTNSTNRVEVNGGNLTLKDTDQGGKIIGDYIPVQVEKGTLNIESGTYETTGNCSGQSSFYAVYSKGTLNISGGTLVSNSATGSAYGVRVNSGTGTISGATIIVSGSAANAYGIYGAGNVDISNVTINVTSTSANGTGYAVVTYKNATIQDSTIILEATGKVEGTAVGIAVEGAGSDPVIIENVDLDVSSDVHGHSTKGNTYGVRAKAGSIVEIKGNTTIDVNYTYKGASKPRETMVLHAEGTSTVINVRKGTFTGNSSNTASGIYAARSNSATSTVNIYGGTFTTSGGTNTADLFASDGAINVHGGEFTGTRVVRPTKGSNPVVDVTGNYKFYGGRFTKTVDERCIAEGYHCVAEGENFVVAAHSYTPVVTEPTCVAGGYTTNTCTCGHSYVSNETSKLGHDFEHGTVTETFAGNCQTESYVTTKCSRCDVTNTVKGEKNPAVHTNLVKDAAVPATCTETGLEEGQHCEACGVVTIAQKETAKLGHDFEHGTVTDEFAGNCQTESYVTTKCSRCDVTNTVKGEKNPAVHTNLVKDAAVPATCTETGLEEGEHCEDCGVVTIAQKETAKLGHDFEHGTVTETFAGNCQTESYVTTKCSRCDVTNTVKGEKNPAVHTNLVKDAAVPATCTETGLEEGQHCEACGVVTIAQKETAKLGHDFEHGTVTEEFAGNCQTESYVTTKCSRCDVTNTVKGEKNPAVHTNLVKDAAVAATCTATGLEEGEHCEACGVVTIAQKETPKLGHDFEHGTVTDEFAGNCQTESYVTTKCSRCDVTETVKGEKNTAVHTNLVKDAAVAATCTATGLEEGEHCEACGVVTIAQKETPKLGHDFEHGTVTDEFAGNCQTESYVTTKCSRCDVTETVKGEKNPAVHTNLVKDAAVPATCTETGLEAGEHCDDCGVVTIAQKETSKLGHDFENGTVTDEFAGNCQTESYVTTKCSRCDVTNTVKGEKNPAVHTNLVKDDAVPATCTATGLEEGEHCEACGVVTIAQKETAKLGHDFEHGTVTEEFAGNCQTESYVTTKCSRCDVTNTVKGEKNPAVHTNLVKDAAVAATCTATGLEEGEHCEDCGVVTIAQTTIPATGHTYTYTSNGDKETHTIGCEKGDLTETAACVDADNNKFCDLCEQKLLDPVAIVNGTDEYESLADAIAAADGKTVTLVKDIELTEKLVVNGNVTLDLNGKELKLADVANNYSVVINGELTINDSEQTGKVILAANGYGLGLSKTATGLTINGGTFDGTANEYAYIVGIYGGTATINGGTFLSPYCVANAFEAGAKVEVKGGTFHNEGEWAAYFTVMGTDVAVSGGTFDNEILGGYMADGYVIKQNADGTFSAEEGTYVAEIIVDGYVFRYVTLAEAIAEAEDGDTVKLLADTELTEKLVVNSDVTLDLNGKELKLADVANNYSVVINGELTINDSEQTGKVILAANGYGLGLSKTATGLTINGGTFDGTANEYAYIVGIYGGTATINGGTFLSPYCVANAFEAGAKVEVKGGTFHNEGEWAAYFTVMGTDVAVSGGTFDNEILGGYMADGYVIKQNADGTFSPAEGTYVAEIVADGYTYRFDTLEEALTEAQPGDTVKLLADVTASKIITVDKAITIDGNGKKLTSTAGRAINIDTTGKVVINDLTIKAGERAINIINQAATVELNDVTATAKNNAVMIATTAGAVKLTINDSDLTGLAVVNVAGAGSDVAINNTKITNVDASANENYGAISVFKTAENSTVTVNGGEIVVADDSVAASVGIPSATVTFNGTVGAEKVQKIVAYIGDAGFTTIEEALAYAKAGQTIVLVDDVTASKIITVDKAITIDGNGKKLTSTAGRAINVSGADGVTIKNLTIDAKGERAINVIQGATNVTIENVTATAANYTVNVAASAANAVVAVKDSDLTGKNVVNVAAANADVTVDNTTITSIDDSSAEGYSAICLNKDAKGGKIVATNVTINVNDDSVKATNGAENGTITINGSTEDVDVDVAYISYGDNYYGFTTIEEAIAKAKEGETIVLIRDVTATEIITVDKAITIDGNGKKLTSTAGRAINVSGADGVTIKNLTINAKGERAINVIQGATNVTIDNVTATAANYTVNVAASAANAVVAVKNSDLTGKNVVNVAAANADVTVDNTTITSIDDSSAEGYSAICLNKDAKGGKIVATNVTINVNDDSVKATNGAENGTITINGSTEDVDVDVAYISYGDNYYGFTTIEEAIAKAEEGETIVLIRDVTATEIITVDKAITIDGNGCTLTSTAGRAINVDCAGIVNINDLTIVGKTGCQRGINVINQAGTTNLNNVTVSGVSHYAVHVATSANAAKVNIADSNLSAWGAVAAYGNGAVVNVKDSALVGTNTFTGETDNFATVAAGNNVTINVTGGSITAVAQSDKTVQHIACTMANVTGATFVLDTELIFTEGNGIINTDVENNYIAVREIYADQILSEGYLSEGAGAGMVTPAGEAAASINGVGYTTLQDAIDAAEELDEATIVVLNDQSLTQHIIISEGITLDLNGHSVVTTKTISVFGDVIDGTVGGYGYISGKRVMIDGAKSYLSIYDSAVSGYRFYKYQLVNLGGRASGTNAAQFGFRLVMENVDGYTVLANSTNAGVSLTAYVTWTGFNNKLMHEFKTETIQKFAKQAAAQLASNGVNTKAIILTVTGLNSLPAGADLKTSYELSTETGIGGTTEEATWTPGV